MRLIMVLSLLFFIIWAAVTFAKYQLRRWLKKSFATPSATPQNSEKLVKCNQCQTFIPLSQARVVKDCYYYCQDCR